VFLSHVRKRKARDQSAKLLFCRLFRGTEECESTLSQSLQFLVQIRVIRDVAIYREIHEDVDYRMHLLDSANAERLS